MIQPTLASERLVLRPLTLKDAPRIHQLINTPLIADVTAHIPHPYPDGLAESWISSHAQRWQTGELAAFGIELKSEKQLIGVMSLNYIRAHNANIGYWIGIEYWGKGYASEACKNLVTFGFERLGLERIRGNHLTRNPASGKVLQKNGFVYQGSRMEKLGLRHQEEKMDFYILEKPSVV